MPNSKVPVWFWIISIIALLWNLMGAGAFVSEMVMSPEDLYAGFTESQMELANQYPSWTKIFYGLATICGFLACVGLLLRKRWSLGMFCLSLLGVLVYHGYTFLGTNAIDVLEPTEAIYLPALVAVISIFLVWFTKKCIDADIVA